MGKDIHIPIWWNLIIALLVVVWGEISFTSPPANSAELKRDPAQVRAFRKLHPCPSTGNMSGACLGFVVDHLVPICWGGKDDPSNMAWQSVDDAKKKDVFEKAACAMKRKLEAK